MKWKEIYEKTLKNICEKPAQKNTTIVDVDWGSLIDKLEKNENAKNDALFSMKLNDGATEKDYKLFCELIFSYIGLDIYDFIPKDFDDNDDLGELEDVN